MPKHSTKPLTNLIDEENSFKPFLNHQSFATDFAIIYASVTKNSKKEAPFNETYCLI